MIHDSAPVHARHRSRGLSLLIEQSNGLLQDEVEELKDAIIVLDELDELDEIDEKIHVSRTGHRMTASAITALLLPSIRHTIDFLTPTITLQYLYGPARKLRSTAYLDGLRGVAALIVAFHHFSLKFFPALKRGYGSSEDDIYIFQLPILRVLVAGRFMVAVFFCISGYVLSYNALKLIHGRQEAKLLRSLSSSFFRRWGRIMLPCVASILLSFCLYWFQLQGTYLPSDWRSPFPDSDRSYIEDDPDEHHFEEPIMLQTFSAQAWEAIKEMWAVSDPWRFGAYFAPRYNGVLWTISTELMGSFVVYALVLTLAFVRPKWRFLFLALLGLQVSAGQHCDYVLFLAGIAVAEINLLLEASSAPLIPITSYLPTQMPLSRMSWPLSAKKCWPYMLFIFGLYAGSHATNFAETPGFVMLSWFVPSIWGGDRDMFDFFWPAISAVLVVGSISQSLGLKRIFETAVCQWLGELSFAMYLVHMFIVHGMARSVIPWCIQAVGWMMGPGAELLEDEEEVGGREEILFAVGMGTGCLMVLGVLFWVSDLFTRVVDQRAVRWAKELEEWAKARDLDAD